MTDAEIEKTLLEVLAREQKLASALREMQIAAAEALKFIKPDDEDGPVGSFLVAIHRHACAALSCANSEDGESHD